MTLTLSNRAFLSAVAANLAVEGGETLARPQHGGPAWLAGWDEAILCNTPGAVRVYAFADASSNDVQANLDALAAGLAGSGIPGQLSLIVVLVSVRSVTAGERRRLLHLSPHAYYPGLRPVTCLVDLSTANLFAGSLGRQPAGVEAIRRALRGDVPAGDVAAARAVHASRLDAFYQLMHGRRPWVTYVLIAVNVLVFAALYATGGLSIANLVRFGALVPALVQDGQWYRLFSSMFLHAGIPHILFNMLSLFVVGTVAERLYGSLRFLGIYLGAGLIGSLVSFGYSLIAGDPHIVGVGASGAIFGAAGALTTLRFQPSYVIPAELRQRISASMVPLVALSLLLSYLTPHVDNSAHIGGLLGGIALSFLFPLYRRTRGVGLPA
ncbi:MAG: rhomboid family intramembrane serine protease [Chloroflexota bacterium]